MEKEKFTIVRPGEFEKNGKWSLVRRSLGLTSFGINMVELMPGESIPEHAETDRDQEEVFIAWKGNPTMVIDGKEYQITEGTFVRLDPEPKRAAKNDTQEAVVLLIASAPTTSGYAPMEWA